jgi:hypothetical protein
MIGKFRNTTRPIVEIFGDARMQFASFTGVEIFVENFARECVPVCKSYRVLIFDFDDDL